MESCRFRRNSKSEKRYRARRHYRLRQKNARRHKRRTRDSLGFTMKICWIPVSPDSSGKYLASPGNRYAVLLNVDSRASLSTVADELKKQNFNVTYSWQSGQAVRGEFLIDRWIRSLPAPAPGKTWMYLELDYAGNSPKVLASSIKKCVLFICGTADIVNAFEAQSVSDDTHPCGPGDPQTGNCPACPPPSPGCTTPEFQWKPAVAAGVAGLLFGWLIGR
jgi:hypothetical protein